MPIPFLVPGVIAAASAVATAVGIGSGAKAIKKNKKAKSINAEAQSTFDKAKSATERARDKSNKSLEKLGKTKLNVLDQSMNHFVEVFDQIHNVKLKDSVGLDELSKFHLSRVVRLPLAVSLIRHGIQRISVCLCIKSHAPSPFFTIFGHGIQNGVLSAIAAEADCMFG